MKLRILLAAFTLAAVAALAALLGSTSENAQSDMLAGKRLYYSAWGETAYSCIYCHADFDENRPRDEYRRPAHPLVGVSERPSYFAGAYLGPSGIGLARAVNTCIVAWLGSEPLAAQSAEMTSLLTYLDSISADTGDAATAPVPIEKGGAFTDAPVGNPRRGEKLFQAACALCHRAGGITSPYDFAIPRSARRVWNRVRGHSLAEASPDSAPTAKMPFFSVDRLSDRELADIIAYLEWQFALAVPVQPEVPLLGEVTLPLPIVKPAPEPEPEPEPGEEPPPPPDDEPPPAPDDADNGATDNPPFNPGSAAFPGGDSSPSADKN